MVIKQKQRAQDRIIMRVSHLLSNTRSSKHFTARTAFNNLSHHHQQKNNFYTATTCFSSHHDSSSSNITDHPLSDVIIGVYSNGELTPTGKLFLSNDFQKSAILKKSKWEAGKVRLIYNDPNSSHLSRDHEKNVPSIHRIALVCVGENDKATTTTTSAPSKHANSIFVQQFSPSEETTSVNALKTASVRSSVSAAMSALIKDDEDATSRVFVDDFDSNRSQVAQALQHSIFKFDVLKNIKEREQKSKKDKDYHFELLSKKSDCHSQQQETKEEGFSAFVRGTVYGESQNMARFLGEMPANFMTPTIFCNTVSERVKSLDHQNSISIEIHDRSWAQNKQMGSFLSVAKGSAQEPKVLEMTYIGNPSNSDQIDLCLVGKGITFDSGGISLKPGAGMKDMRGDMGGAATTCSAFYGIAKLKLPLNVKVICMMCENMPGPDAVKPGDVIQAMNKVTIEVDNTDAEGRLILADGLCYASEIKPKMLVDVATLTGAIVVALGNACTGAYTTSNESWKQIEKAGLVTNDYMWRMPLFIDTFKKQLKSSTADLNNIGGKEAGSCTAATFLSSFVDFDKVEHWAHLDIAGSFMEKDGMTGRPTRALIQLASQLASQQV